jgi:hypothetical protein
VLAALESGGFAQIIADATQSDEMQAAMTKYQETRARLGGLLADFYTETNRYAREEMLKLKGEIEARIDQFTRQIERLDSTRLLGNMPFGQQVKDLWKGADQQAQRDLIALVIDSCFGVCARSVSICRV